MEKADKINKVLDSISKVAMNENETDCENKLEEIKEIINKSPNTRSISEICKVIDGTSGGKSKTKKKNYKKKTKTRSKTRRKNKRKRNKRRKTYKKKK